MENYYILNEMLKGNINRINMTDDLKELKEMYKWADYRLNTLYNAKLNEINNKQKEEIK